MKQLLKLALSNKERVEFDGSSAITTDMASWVYADCPQPALLGRRVTVDANTIKAAFALSPTLTFDGNRVNGLSFEDAWAGGGLPAPDMRDEVFTEPFALDMGVIKRLAPIVPKADIRQWLNALCFDFTNRALMATDGCRLYAYAGALPENAGSSQLRVPHAFIYHMLTRKNVTMSFSERFVKIAFAGGRAVGKLIDSKYLDYRYVIPEIKDCSPISFDRSVLAESVKKLVEIARIQKAKWPSALFDFNAGTIVYEEIVLPAGILSGRSARNEAKFGSRYLLDVINAVGCEAIWFFGEEGEALLVVDDDFSAVVMPMR